MLYKVALTFESVDKILKCDHSLSFGAVYYAVQGVYSLLSLRMKSKTEYHLNISCRPVLS